MNARYYVGVFLYSLLAGGAFFFCGDLILAKSINAEVSFVKVDYEDKNDLGIIFQLGVENEEWRKKMFGDVPTWYRSDPSNRDFNSNLTPSNLWTYDRTKAVEYADKYATSPNDDYRYYDDNDCTNFVSQSLEAGKKPYRNDTRTSDNAWYYGWYTWTTSYTWAASNNLFRHLQNHTDSEIITDFTLLQKGDLIYMDYNNSGTFDHTMIISTITEDDIYLNYHSEDKYQEPLSDIKEKYPNATYKGVIIKSGCGDGGC